MHTHTPPPLLHWVGAWCNTVCVAGWSCFVLASNSHNDQYTISHLKELHNSMILVTVSTTCLLVKLKKPHTIANQCQPLVCLWKSSILLQYWSQPLVCYVWDMWAQANNWVSTSCLHGHTYLSLFALFSGGPVYIMIWVLVVYQCSLVVAAPPTCVSWLREPHQTGLVSTTRTSRLLTAWSEQ